jgi:hypothetical protein
MKNLYMFVMSKIPTFSLTAKCSSRMSVNRTGIAHPAKGTISPWFSCQENRCVRRSLSFKVIDSKSFKLTQNELGFIFFCIAQHERFLCREASHRGHRWAQGWN